MTKGRTARPTHFVRGVICALLGASLWGFSGACAQLLLSTYEVPATSVTAIRMIGAGVIFLAVILVRKRAVLLEALRDRKTVLQLVFFGIFGLFLSQITYLTTIDYTKAPQRFCNAWAFSLWCCLPVCVPGGSRVCVKPVALRLPLAQPFSLPPRGILWLCPCRCPGFCGGLPAGWPGPFTRCTPGVFSNAGEAL